MNTNYARALRYVKQMRTELENLLKNPTNKDAEIRQLVTKIKNSLHRLRRQFSKNQLRHALGGLAVLFGLAAAPEASAQVFAPGVTNPFGLTSTSGLNLPSLVDIDGDGDLDLVVIEDYGVLKYFQNTGSSTSPQFAAPTTPNWLGSGIVLDIAFGDLDGDGDYDIIGFGYYGDLYYFQNTGSATNPQFANPVSNPFGFNDTTMYIASPTLVDIDGDGDLDLFFGDFYGDIYYFENTGTASAPNFSTPAVLNPFGINSFFYIRIPKFVDLDGDGDYDLLLADYYGDIYYYENTGSATSPQFGAPQSNPFNFTGANYVNKFAAGDMDGDGDIDLFMGVDGFSSPNYGADFIYFENLSNPGASTDSFNRLKISVSPNPTSDLVSIQTEANIHSVKIMDINGRLVREVQSTEFSIQDLPAGVYFLNIIDENRAERRERIVKK
jgi:CO dehydrogenase/acetyl-CoA synthase epsilon subunit